MSLSPAQIDHVRTTWAVAAQTGPLAASLFYGKLFQIAPETRRLFHQDLTLQQKKLIATLGFVVENLHLPDVVEPAARALAIRHVGYGVTADQYAPVGEALVWMLREVLGQQFGEREQAAWETAYQDLSTLMIDAAYARKPQ